MHVKYYSTGCSVIKYQPPEQIPKIKLSIGKKRKERKDAVVGGGERVVGGVSITGVVAFQKRFSSFISCCLIFFGVAEV